MEEAQGVAWGVEASIGRIELRRPQLANVLETPAAHALAAAIAHVLDAQPKLVLLSAQGRIFCGGGDIGEFARAGDRLDAVVDAILDVLHPAIVRLATAPLPVISAVQGPIGGAGVGLALCADFVLAATSMKLRTGYAALGLSPDVGSSCFLARRVGSQRAKQWLMLNDPIDAATCLQYGAVDAVVPDAELAAHAQALARRLAGGARASMAAIKSLCNGSDTSDVDARLAQEHALLRACATTADAREGVAAFLARRAPRFDA